MTWRALIASIFLCQALGAAEKISSPGAKPLPDPPGVHNLYLLGTNIFSGSTPEGHAGFQSLSNLGVKTIISVDGAAPEVALAKKFGLRYVHLPHGYDGISSNLQLHLAKAAQQLDPPIYVHCHHGKHRGPTAAAILCLTKNSWTTSQAEQWLIAAGTSTNYSGLYQTIRSFKQPDPDFLKSFHPHFPEVAKVSGLVDSMVAIDHTWENLKAIRTAGYQTPTRHPDLNPANEALLLHEHFREAQRLHDCTPRPPDFSALLQKAEAQSKTAEQLLRNLATAPTHFNLRARLDTSFDALAQSCFTCHSQFRDR